MADYHRVDPTACYGIMAQAEGYGMEAEAELSAVSGEVDSVASACTGHSSSIASALNSVYNRALGPSMTGAVQQINGAAAGGRDAVAAIQNGHYEMAANSARDARAVETVKITDRK